MKVKLDLDIDTKDIVQGLRSKINSTFSMAVAATVQEGKDLANNRLKKGRSHWLKGYKTHKVNNNFYIISIEGKLANWMEDGIEIGEVSDAIMSGNRASYNRSEGKNYVDVPIFKDADQVGNIRGTNINVAAFRDADTMLKSVKFSKFKEKSVLEERRIVSRVEDIIKSVNPRKKGKTSYLTIRRVNKNSNWPDSPYEGAKVLDDLEDFIDKKFEDLLKGI